MLASDAGVRLTPFHRFDQVIACGMAALDLTASQTIGLATRQAARALGIAETVGSIEAGKTADLIALDGILDDNTTQLGQIRGVWQAGRLVAKNTNSIKSAQVS